MASFEKRIDGLISDLTNAIKLLNCPLEDGLVEEEERALQTNLQSLLNFVEDNEKEDIVALLPLLFNIQKTYFSSYGDEMNGYADRAGSPVSLLTVSNVEINALWESICYVVEKIVEKDMIYNPLCTVMQRQLFLKELQFITEVKSGSFWQFYEGVRWKKLELAHQMNDSLSAVICTFQKLVEFEMALVSNEYFKTCKLSFNEFTGPYVSILFDYVEKNLLADRVDVEVLRKSAVDLIAFDRFVHRFESCFSSSVESPLFNGIRSWQTAFVQKGFNNVLLRELNSRILSFIKNFEGQLSKMSFSADNKVISRVRQLFEMLDLYCDIDLDGFLESFGVIVNMTVVDFVMQSTTIKADSPFEFLYLALNTLYFAKHKFIGFKVNCEKLDCSIQRVTDALKARHFGVLIRFKSYFEYWLLYFKRLWLKLNTALTYGHATSCSIYMDILRDSLMTLTTLKLGSDDILVILSNVSDLIPFTLQPNAESDSHVIHEINNCCWILLCRYAVYGSTIRDLCQTIELTKESAGRSSSHWLTHVDPSRVMSSPYLSALHCCRHYHQPPASTLLRPFLEQKCSLSIRVLTLSEVCERDDFAENFSLAVFKILMLHESQPNAVAVVMSCLFERLYGGLKVPVPHVADANKSWWFCVFEKLLAVTVADVMNSFLPMLLFETYISTQSVSSQVTRVRDSLKLENFDESSVLESFTASLLSGISTIVVISPVQLLSSLTYMQGFMDKDINFAFNSLPIHVIVSAIVTFIQRLVDSEFSGANNVVVIKEKLVKRICDVAYGSNVAYPEQYEYIHKMLEEKTSRVNYIITSESNHIEILETLLSDLPNCDGLLEYLFKFLKSNETWIVSCVENQETPTLNLDFRASPVDEFDITKLYEHICTRCAKAKNKIQWKKLISDVVGRLSNMSLSYLLSEREDLMYSDAEEAKRVRDMYGIKEIL